MAVLVCTVRGCRRPLAREGEALRCHRGHSFDRARAGYWNLLQPQDRRAKRPGDTRAQALARRRWLERGFAEGLAACVEALAGLDALAPESVLLDVGCGEGWFTARLAKGRPLDVVGADLSVHAIELAARRDPSRTWIVCNADRILPLLHGSVACAVSIFGRRPAAELARVLQPSGRLVAVVPGPDDLAELREVVSGRAVSKDRVAVAVAELAPAFVLAERASWRERAYHDAEALRYALAMTYRGQRARERARLARHLAEHEGFEVTLAAEVLRFEKHEA